MAADGRHALTLAQARAFILRRAGAWYHAGGQPVDPVALVQGIGYLQVDPVAVVAANHHLIAWGRVPGYQTAHLDDELYTRRSLVESYQGIHAIFPMRDWRYYDGRTGPPTRLAEEDPALVARVLAAITERGPLGGRDFSSDDDRAKITYGWGSTPRAQAALSSLARRGFIVVHHRVGGEKYYDIPDRVVPTDVDTTPVTDDERAFHHAERELTYQGLTTLRRYFKPIITAGAAIPVEITGVRGAWYLPAVEVDAAHAALPIRNDERRAHILPPLDPLVHDRDRLEALWGFAYRWEVYVPVAKRKYGPYTLPVLWGDQFIARLDPSLDRKGSVMHIRALWFESDAPDDPALYTDLAAEIGRFAAFHGDAAVSLGTVTPESRTAPLVRALAAVVPMTGTRE